MDNSKTLLMIREYLKRLHPPEGLGAPKNDHPDVALGAMREEELVRLINHWEITEKQAIRAYEQLNRLDSSKYPQLPNPKTK